jgi:hypothetical protein
VRLAGIGHGRSGQGACDRLRRCQLRHAETDRREHARDQRAQHEEADQKGGDRKDRRFDDLEPIGAVETEERRRRRNAVAAVDLGEGHVDDLKLVAPRLVDANRGAHERLDLVHLAGRAGRIGGFSARIGRGRAVDSHGDGKALHRAAVFAACLDGLGDFVIRRLFGAVRARLGVVRARTGAGLAARKLACDRRRARLSPVRIRRVLLDGLRRTHDLRIRIVGLGRLVGVIVVHVGGDLHADMTGTHDARNDVLDALAHPVFEIVGLLIFVGARGIGAGLVVAAGQKIATIVDDGDAIGRKARNSGGHEVLDRLDLAVLHHAARLEHDRCARRLLVARKDLAFRNDEMHARRVDAVDGLDRA